MTEESDPGVAREHLCRLLSACYYELGAEFAEERVFEVMSQTAARLNSELASLADGLAAAFAAERPDDLLIDYTRLFLGPNEILAKPYGSVWLGGEEALMQDSTMAVLALYREADFDLDDEFRELPDHVATELEFLYLLIHRENAARAAGDAEALTAMHDLKQRFLSTHLGVWVTPFAQAMEQGAGTEFYRLLAALTVRFVAMEAARRR